MKAASARSPTHRVAIANSRLVTIENDQVAFRWKDYRHQDKVKVMALAADEFIRRFLLHTLPDAFHRIRHYGFLANGHRAAKLARCRGLLAAPAPQPVPPAADYREQYLRLTGRSLDVCPCCGGRIQRNNSLRNDCVGLAGSVVTSPVMAILKSLLQNSFFDGSNQNRAVNGSEPNGEPCSILQEA